MSARKADREGHYADANAFALFLIIFMLRSRRRQESQIEEVRKHTRGRTSDLSALMFQKGYNQGLVFAFIAELKTGTINRCSAPFVVGIKMFEVVSALHLDVRIMISCLASRLADVIKRIISIYGIRPKFQSIETVPITFLDPAGRQLEKVETFLVVRRLREGKNRWMIMKKKGWRRTVRGKSGCGK